MAVSYIVERLDNISGERTYQDVGKRPTQHDLRDRGYATYTLRRGDGSAVKKWRVVRNRNGNPKVETETPVQLEGITTQNLERMLRSYERIVRYWPAKASDVRKIQSEIDARSEFLATVASVPSGSAQRSPKASTSQRITRATK